MAKARERALERPDINEMVGDIHVLADENTVSSLRALSIINRLLQLKDPDIWEEIELNLAIAEEEMEKGDRSQADIDTEIFLGQGP